VTKLYFYIKPVLEIIHALVMFLGIPSINVLYCVQFYLHVCLCWYFEYIYNVQSNLSIVDTWWIDR